MNQTRQRKPWILRERAVTYNIHGEKTEKRKSQAEKRHKTPPLMELAINDGNDKKNKDRNDSNGDYPIRSHPIKVSQIGILKRPHRYLALGWGDIERG